MCYNFFQLSATKLSLANSGLFYVWNFSVGPFLTVYVKNKKVSNLYAKRRDGASTIWYHAHCPHEGRWVQMGSSLFCCLYSCPIRAKILPFWVPIVKI
jgi:hypothetical protein